MSIDKDLYLQFGRNSELVVSRPAHIPTNIAWLELYRRYPTMYEGELQPSPKYTVWEYEITEETHKKWLGGIEVDISTENVSRVKTYLNTPEELEVYLSSRNIQVKDFIPRWKSDFPT